MTLEFFSATDTGRSRNNNEDSVAIDDATALLVLADGMGGHQHGEIASTIAMQTLSMMFQMQARPTIKKPERFLEEIGRASCRERV